MIVSRSRKRRVAPVCAAVGGAFGRRNLPLLSLPTVVGVDMLSLPFSRCGHCVRYVINRVSRCLSTDFSHHGHRVHAVRSRAMPRTEGNGTASVAVLAKAMALIDRIAEV